MRRINGLVALGFMFLAGCSSGATQAPATTPAADPVAVLQDSLTRSLESTVKVDAKVTSGPGTLEFSGAVDPAARVFKLSVKTHKPLEVLAVGDSLYLKRENTGGKAWLLIDIRKLKATSGLRQSLDPRSNVGILAGIVSAEYVAPGRYRGVADLHKAAAAAPESARMSLEAAAKVAKNASAIAFEATVDAQGRLTSLTYTIDTPAGPVKTELTVRGFGEPVTVTLPPDDQVKVAPESVYANL